MTIESKPIGSITKDSDDATGNEYWVFHPNIDLPKESYDLYLYPDPLVSKLSSLLHEIALDYQIKLSDNIKLEAKVKELEETIVSVFSENEYPEYTQGLVHHELLEPVTASYCTNLIVLIKNLEDKVKELEKDANRWKALTLVYTDNPNLEKYHKATLHVPWLYVSNYTKKSFDEAFDKYVSQRDE